MTKTRINWEQVRTQLRASEHALEEALAGNPARIQAAFRKRAAQLAADQRSTAPQAVPIPVLIFTLQAERYAIRLHQLAEVLPFRQCTPVPGTPREYLGVISRHGELRPVLDLARLITPASDTPPPGFVLMLRKPGHPLGLCVHTVEGLRDLSPQQLDSSWQGSYTTKITGESLLLLDLPRVLEALP